jgi:hypothetical protein
VNGSISGARAGAQGWCNVVSSATVSFELEAAKSKRKNQTENPTPIQENLRLATGKFLAFTKGRYVTAEGSYLKSESAGGARQPMPAAPS